MSEQRNGGWNDLDEQYDLQDPLPDEYRVHEIPAAPRQRRRIKRNTGDNLREFFYWFVGSGGLRRLPKLLTVIAVIALVAWIVANRNAILQGFIGLVTELIPIALLIWLLWTCIRGIFNPK